MPTLGMDRFLFNSNLVGRDRKEGGGVERQGTQRWQEHCQAQAEPSRIGGSTGPRVPSSSVPGKRLIIDVE